MAPVDYIPRIRDNYARLGYRPYNWVRNADTPPWAPLSKPLSKCRLGLAASGGISATGQVAFHYKDDISIREIPADVDTKGLRATHFAYDLSGARTDPNVVFPTIAYQQSAPVPTCTYTVSPTSQNVPAAGGTYKINVGVAGSDCSWTASTSAPWITGITPANGTTSAPVNYMVAKNTTGKNRTGTINVAGQTVTVSQKRR